MRKEEGKEEGKGKEKEKEEKEEKEDLVERVPDVRVRVFFEGVKIAADVAIEEHRILWDDRHL